MSLTFISRALDKKKSAYYDAFGMEYLVHNALINAFAQMVWILCW